METDNDIALVWVHNRYAREQSRSKSFLASFQGHTDWQYRLPVQIVNKDYSCIYGMNMLTPELLVQSDCLWIYIVSMGVYAGPMETVTDRLSLPRECKSFEIYENCW